MVSSSLYPQHREPVGMNRPMKDLLQQMHNAWVMEHKVVYSLNKHGRGIMPVRRVELIPGREEV